MVRQTALLLLYDTISRYPRCTLEIRYCPRKFWIFFSHANGTRDVTVDIANISGVLPMANFVYTVGYLNTSGGPCGVSAVYEGLE